MTKYITVGTLLGRDISDWARIEDAMQCARVDVREACNRINPNKQTARLEVFDNSNRSRLLGTMQVPDMDVMRGPVIRMCVPQRVTASCVEYGLDIDRRTVSTVDFFWEYGKHEVKGWQRVSTAVLYTSAKLEDLMKLEAFRLPGETYGQQQQQRLYNAR